MESQTTITGLGWEIGESSTKITGLREEISNRNDGLEEMRRRIDELESESRTAQTTIT